MEENSSISNVTVKLIAGCSFVKYRPLFSLDSKYMFLAADNDIKVIRTASGECLRRLVGHSTPVVGMQRHPINHTQLMSCSRDGTILTWDYMDGVNLKEFKIKGDADVLAFYAPGATRRVFVVHYNKQDDAFQLRSAYLKQKLNSTRFVMKDIIPHSQFLDFGNKGSFVASINDNRITVFDLVKGVINRHMAQSKFTCISCHPSEYVVAAGDETGRILVWSNIFDRTNLCRSVYHWHTLPVAGLCFSSEGFYLYSGGAECVLVKWSLQGEERDFLPRMGMPICHVVTSPDNVFVGVSHCDNAVSLVSSQLQLLQHIQGLSQWHPWTSPEQDVAPTGLLHDPRTGALVLSGRPGHIQFYSLSHDKQLYSVDIVGENFLTQERNQTIHNTQVEKAAIDSSGLWMSTVQRYDDGSSSEDITLKVWKFNSKLQTYSLNTTVILPHYKKVNCVTFRPDMEEETPLFVTASEDLSFKTWALQTSLEGSNSKEAWACESRGHYHDQNPTDVSFKQDGSVLAVCFGCTITLWMPSPLVPSTTFSHSACSSHIRQVLFGRDTCSHFLVTRTDDCLNVWDTTIHKVSWKARLATTRLAADPLSEYIAAFGQDHTLFIFKPSSPEPCFIKGNVSSSDVIAAAFVPFKRSKMDTESSLNWQKKSQLYYLNKVQELLTVTDGTADNKLYDESSENEDQKTTSDHQVPPGYSFSDLLAERISSHNNTTDHHSISNRHSGAKHIKELMEIPSHIIPPVRSLCTQFMNALLIPKFTEVK